MYVPTALAETRLDVLHAFMRGHAFAQVISTGAAGIDASHVPVVLRAEKGEFGAIQFHLARQNGQWKELESGGEALVIFQGPHGYISPRWYETAVNVPTWNYVAVHARGTPRMLSDEELGLHVRELVGEYERPEIWDTGKMPGDFLEKLQRMIVGFEISITRIEGKWKLGQNRTHADREGAIRGLRETGSHDAAVLAEWMEAALKKASG